MSIKETRIDILNSDEFLLSEFKKLQYLYGLKHEIRYNDSRKSNGMGESVAEHIYGMLICANYFLPLEDIEGNWDRATTYDMITWHDIDELETGDTIGFLKTDAHRQAEAQATPVVLGKTPDHIRSQVEAVLESYTAKATPEAKFVKAIDKMDTLIQAYTETGKNVLLRNQTTIAQHNQIKLPYMPEFPYLERFYQYITARMEQEGFFIA